MDWNGCPKDARVLLPNTGAGRSASPYTWLVHVNRHSKYEGGYRQIMVFPSDWSHLGDNKAVIERFGRDENYWKANFVKAFNKIAELGWKDKLGKCKPVTCNFASEARTLSCAMPYERRWPEYGVDSWGRLYLFKKAKTW